MRRTILGGLVLVAATASACGAESRLGTYGNPDSGPGDLASRPAGTAWATAHQKLLDLTSARYTAALANQRCSKASTSDCQLTTQTIHNNGVFSLKPATLASNLVVKVPATEDAGKGNQSVEMRELPDGSLYSRDSTTPDSCWITWDPTTYTATFEAGFRTGLEVLRSAEVDYDLPATSSSAQLSAKANALAVVRTLGLAPAFDNTYGITPAIRRDLAGKTVAIKLNVGAGGNAVSFTVDGSQVATEINPGGSAGAGGYLATVKRSWSSFSISDFGATTSVAAPPKNQTLPQGAPAGADCS